ncbi:hypothetical protein C8R44DRAFT_224361 [Mycena epipterygia]|nr:hypothetical protein C8R44DRAFT_224361 [Mycena epipterygia]
MSPPWRSTATLPPERPQPRRAVMVHPRLPIRAPGCIFCAGMRGARTSDASRHRIWATLARLWSTCIRIGGSSRSLFPRAHLRILTSRRIYSRSPLRRVIRTQVLRGSVRLSPFPDIQIHGARVGKTRAAPIRYRILCIASLSRRRCKPDPQLPVWQLPV